MQSDNSPALHAVVSITDQTGLNRQVNADEAGRFEIGDLPRGRYYLTAVNPSAPDQLADPVVVELNFASISPVSANIYLRNRVAKPSIEQKKPGIVSLGEEREKAPKPARKAYEQAIKLRDEKQYDQSLKKFGRSIELFPSYFQALAERGHLLMAMGKVPEALKDFEQALELNARYGPALRGSGLCKFQQGKYAEAIQDLERATDAEPGNATNYYFMGIACVALDRRDQARAALHKALSIDPVASVRAHVHLASLLIKENHPQEAAKEIEIYLEAVPNPFDAEKLRVLLSQLRAAAKL
jgi:tetratricopeptide (TPR) repeat protein